MRVVRSVLTSFAVMLALSGVGRAQEVSEDIVDATVGDWLIVSEDGSLGCHITLKKDKTIGGRPWRKERRAAHPGMIRSLLGISPAQGSSCATRPEKRSSVLANGRLVHG